jgi:hypothetical protein
MPTTANNHWQVPRFPKFLVALIPIGMLISGWGLSERVSPLSADSGAVTTITNRGTEYVTRMRTVERKVHGRIVHVEDKVYVQVPLVVVHVDHRTIRVPAHKLPLRSAAAMVASPLVTIHIPVPTTVYVPTTIYATVTSTVTSTTWVPTTTTISLPFTTGEPPTGN